MLTPGFNAGFNALKGLIEVKFSVFKTPSM